MTRTSTGPRQHPRYPIQISCELTLAGQTLHAETKNLSTGGAAIAFSRPLQVGEVLTVTFFLTEDGIESADRTPFECAASIRWSRPSGAGLHEAGLQFLSPSAEQRKTLTGFLERMA